MAENQTFNGVVVPSGALIADGLDLAIIACLSMPGVTRVLYDYEKCVEVLMKAQNWERDEAVEWMEFNVTSAYMGVGTPLFMSGDDDMSELGLLIWGEPK